jgi:hypothetical protein
MEKPAGEEIKKFIKVFDQLAQFEASQRVVRGYGCFKEEDLPFQEVVKVISWLKQKVNTTEKDLISDLITKYQNLSDNLRDRASEAYAKNDYANYSTYNEEADIYESFISDLKNIGGVSATFKLGKT